jgi:hypothetical protein
MSEFPFSGLPAHLHSVMNGDVSGAGVNRPSSAPGFGQSSTINSNVRMNPRLAVVGRTGQTEDVLRRPNISDPSFQRAPTPPPMSSGFGEWGSSTETGTKQQHTRIPGSSIDGGMPDLLKPDVQQQTGGNPSSVIGKGSLFNDFPRSPSPSSNMTSFAPQNPTPPITPPPQQPGYTAFYAAIAASQSSGAPFNPHAATAAAIALTAQANQQNDSNAQLAAAMYNLNVSSQQQPNASANGIGINAPAFVPPSQQTTPSNDYGNNPYMQQQQQQQQQHAAAYYQYYQAQMQSIDPRTSQYQQRPPSGPPGAHGMSGGRNDNYNNHQNSNGNGQRGGWEQGGYGGGEGYHGSNNGYNHGYNGGNNNNYGGRNSDRLYNGGRGGDYDGDNSGNRGRGRGRGRRGGGGGGRYSNNNYDNNDIGYNGGGYNHRNERSMGRGGRRDRRNDRYNDDGDRRSSRRDHEGGRRDHEGGRRDRGGRNSNSESSLLNELRLSISGRELELSDCLTRLVDLSRDQHGSRFIQQKLDTCDDTTKETVFVELTKYALDIANDVFGNYVMQKLIEQGHSEQKLNIVKALRGSILDLSCKMYGCRVIQKVFETGSLDGHLLLIPELKSNVEELVYDQNGNHVIQRCIQKVRPLSHIRFILEPFFEGIPQLARHPFGCRVVQRILENFLPTDDDGKKVLDEVMESIEILIEDQYGNYVVQHILEHGSYENKIIVTDHVRLNIVRLCRHKFGSNVVELIMKHMPKEVVKSLIDLMLTPEDKKDGFGENKKSDGTTTKKETVPLDHMTTDSYANYVVQRVIRMATPMQLSIIAKRIELQQDTLRHYSYGKHILNCLESQSHRMIGY